MVAVHQPPQHLHQSTDWAEVTTGDEQDS
eukprot:COSAG02_NODE_66032_length_256_cov_0.987261_1_plen_28_part_01